MRPKISIITVCFNCLDDLAATLESIETQTFTDYEVIVVDGGSSDGTAEYLSKSQFVTTFVSEIDRGIYHAMNKGITLSKGEWLYFLNAGDVLITDEVLKQINECELKANRASVITGKVLLYRDGKCLNRTHPERLYKLDDLLKRNIIAHQATFINRSVFDLVGGFSELYRIQGDYDFWMRCFSKRISFQFIDMVVAKFDYTGVSSQRSNYPIALREWLLVLVSSHEMSISKVSLIYMKKMSIYYIKSFLIEVFGVKK